jgi:hypothetical protein
MHIRLAVFRFELLGLALSATPACSQKASNGSATVPPSAVVTQDSLAAAQQFVQQFYDWYAPMADTSHRLAVWAVLRNPAQFLQTGLATAIRGDSAARATTPISRDILDFDLFTGSSNSCKQYEATHAARQGRMFRVSVRSVCVYSGGARGEVVVNVVPEAGQWRIDNVSYTSGDNAKSLLCSYAKADIHKDRRPPKC